MPRADRSWVLACAVVAGFLARGALIEALILALVLIGSQALAAHKAKRDKPGNE